ncbi:MAG: linear amide C-N hydrolase [Anaerolineae bacterium]|nr:linear amide C-N hydrolase [Anaerolineae bacterium]
MKPRQLAWASVIVLVLVLVSGHPTAMSALPIPGDTPLNAPTADLGCTSFCLDNAGHCVFGTNFDNTIYEGLLFVNQRNVSKTSWEANTAGEYASWTSKYGSLTFDLVGYQFAWAGMNEAGLMISTMALGESLAPDPDERFPLVGPVWIQYQLDNYSTVEEVIASASHVRIAAAPPRTVDHYLVCDGSGVCAAFEFLEGKIVYHTGDNLPAAALTNSVYEDAVRAWQEDDLSNNSLTRFGTAADRVIGFEPTDSERAVAYAFETLTQVSSPTYTMWSIVFDPQNLRVYFRTKWNTEIRHIDFSQLDFSCSTPVQMLDVHAELSGDVSDDFVPYSHEVNLAHIMNVLNKFGYDAPRGEMEGLLQQIESYPCAEGEAHIPQEAPRGVFSWIWSVATAMVVIVVIGYIIRRRVGRR